MLKQTVLSVLPVLTAILASGCGPQIVPVTSFRPVAALSDDCDSIRLTTSPAQTGPGSVAIQLATGVGSPWWKEIHCTIISTGRTCGGLHANDGPSTAPGQIVLFPHELSDARLVFTKPKFLGVATDVYQIVDLSPLANQQALFTWVRDRCP
jgi:hypothetical protein